MPGQPCALAMRRAYVCLICAVALKALSRLQVLQQASSGNCVMSGVKVLLDTNFIPGMLKSTPEALAEIASRNLCADKCAHCAVTRMELI